MIFFRVYKYLKYILLATHPKGHGIHSPFIFDLVSRVFRNKTDSVIVCSIETVRKKLIYDHRSIQIINLGSGKKERITNIRKVSEIARYSPVPPKYGQLLYNLASEFGKNAIIELGTSFGISTMYLATGSPESVIYSIEGSQEIAEIAALNFADAGLKNINVLTGSFDEMLPVVFEKGLKPGLVFIDGDHRKEPLLRYFNIIAQQSDNNTVIVIDDIYNSKEMGEAWEKIKLNQKVSVTVDIYRMGIVFFRKGINRNDYIVRH